MLKHWVLILENMKITCQYVTLLEFIACFSHIKTFPHAQLKQNKDLSVFYLASYTQTMWFKFKKVFQLLAMQNVLLIQCSFHESIVSIRIFSSFLS